MTIKRTIKIFIFIFSFFILFSCSKTKTSDSNKNKEVTEKLTEERYNYYGDNYDPPVISLSIDITNSFKNMEIDGKYSDTTNVIEYKTLVFEGKPKKGECSNTTFSLSYPYIKSISIDNNKSNTNLVKINDFILSIISSYDYDKSFSDIEDIRASFFRYYVEYKNNNNIEGDMRWSFDEKITIQSVARGKIFFKRVVDSYLGQQYPSISINYFGYDLPNGKKVSLSDIIKDLDKFNEIGEKYFRKAYEDYEIEEIKERNLPNDASLSELGYLFLDDKFKFNDNFYLTNDSIIFFFNDGEILPHAFHCYDAEIVIPFLEIKDFLF